VSYFGPLVLPLRVPTSRLPRGVQVRRPPTRGKSIGRRIVSAACAESRASAATCFRSRRRFRRIRTAYVTCAATVSARFPAAGRSASPELLTERAGACVGHGGLYYGSFYRGAGVARRAHARYGERRAVTYAAPARRSANQRLNFLY
jgi:hypothetical protein